MPFIFEGIKRSKVADDCLSTIKTLSEDETVFTFENQDLFKLKDGKASFDEAYLIANNNIKEKIADHFSIDGGEDIIPQTPEGYKTIQEVSQEIDIAPNTLNSGKRKLISFFFHHLFYMAQGTLIRAV